jgi:hypothetical protein
LSTLNSSDGLQRPPPPRGAVWEPIYRLVRLNRARRGQLERCGALWLSSRRRASGDRTAWPQRTEDYQRSGYENHPTNGYLCQKQGLEYAYTCRLRCCRTASYESASRSIGHLWCMCRVFTPRAFRRHASRESPRDPTSEKSRIYDFVRYCGREYTRR